MSLNSWSTSQVIWKHVKWKIGEYSHSFITLIAIQIVFYLLGWNGSGSAGGGFNQFQVYIHFYSLDMTVILTCLWIFITSLMMQGKAQQHDDYSVVTNRFVTNVSNSIVVIIYSFVATLIAFATLYIFTLFLQLVMRTELIREELIINPIQGMFIFVIILLVAASGFFIGSAFHFSRIVGISIIVLFIVFLSRLPFQLATIFVFLFDGGDVFFMVKALVGSFLLFGFSILLLNRKEVTRG